MSGLLVWIASYDASLLVWPVRLRTFLLWVGSRSFAIYLIHIPAYRITNEIWFRIAGSGLDSRYTLRFLVAAFVLLAVLAECNYRFLELPLRKRGAKVCARILGG